MPACASSYPLPQRTEFERGRRRRGRFQGEFVTGEPEGSLWPSSDEPAKRSRCQAMGEAEAVTSEAAIKPRGLR